MAESKAEIRECLRKEMGRRVVIEHGPYRWHRTHGIVRDVRDNCVRLSDARVVGGLRTVSPPTALLSVSISSIRYIYPVDHRRSCGFEIQDNDLETWFEKALDRTNAPARAVIKSEKERQADFADSLGEIIGKRILISCDQACHSGNILKVGSNFVTLSDVHTKAWDWLPGEIDSIPSDVLFAFKFIKEWKLI